MRPFIVLAGLVLANLLPPWVGAQGTAPPACPTYLPTALQLTVGQWDVTWIDRVAPHRYDTSLAKAAIEVTAGGCGLLERFDGFRDGRVFAALSLVAPAGADCLAHVWQDSNHGQLLVFRARADSRPLEFEWHRDLGDRILRLRVRYVALEANAFTTETELSPDGGGSWQRVGRSEYRRRP